jgi:hypothetical protein
MRAAHQPGMLHDPDAMLAPHGVVMVRDYL